MNYTPEFEKFCEEGFPEAFAVLTRDRYSVEHFWLSGFARLVREEAKDIGEPDPVDSFYVGEAFNSLCAKFGLEGKP